MTPENFCYWLQGLLKGADPATLNQNQIKIIQEHLSLVFPKLTPNTLPLSKKGNDNLMITY